MNECEQVWMAGTHLDEDFVVKPCLEGSMQHQSFNVMSPIRVQEPVQIHDIFSARFMFGDIKSALGKWVHLGFKSGQEKGPIGHGRVPHFLNVPVKLHRSVDILGRAATLVRKRERGVSPLSQDSGP